MITLFKNGGMPMFFILIFGLVALGTAFWFAVRPNATHEGFIKWMSRATLWSILCGTVSDLATVCYYLSNAQPPPDNERRVAILIEGFAESMSPGIMGFAILSLIALLTAIGRRRLDARKAA